MEGEFSPLKNTLGLCFLLERLLRFLAHMPYWHALEVFPSYRLFVSVCLCVCASNAQCKTDSFNTSQSPVANHEVKP